MAFSNKDVLDMLKEELFSCRAELKYHSKHVEWLQESEKELEQLIQKLEKEEE